MNNISSNERDEREMTVEKEYVTYNDIEEFILKLAKDTNNFKDFNGVYGPARGGLLYAILISERYNLPFLGAPQRGCLCIDDICDSGDTALAWRQKGYTIATHYYKEGAKVEPDYWWKLKGDKWIVFPVEEDTRNKKVNNNE